MGGVSVLVMLAAMGVTYGWQPDGNGGVEYVIQIPPEQLDELEESGEISSVIDPDVQGRVSRIVVKVGRKPLARKSPRALATRSAADHDPMPIPEIDGGTTDVTRDLAGGTRSDHGALDHGALDHDARDQGARDQSEMVMKPQAGGGFSMPPSLSNQSTGASNDLRRNTGEMSAGLQNNVRSGLGGVVDRAAAAGRDMVGQTSKTLMDATDAALGRNLNRSGPSVSNQGAGGQSGVAGARAGAGPTTANPQAYAGNPQAYGGSGATNGLRSSPAQLQPPPFAGSTTRGSATPGSIATTRSGGPSTDPTDDRDRIWYGPDGAPQIRASNTATSSNAAGGSPATLVGPPDLRSSYGQRTPGQTARDSAGQVAPSGYGTTTNFGRLPDGLQVPAQTFNASSDQRQPQNRNTYGDSFGATTRGDEPSAQKQQREVDPSLDPRNLPPGAWALNVYGQPIDREGRVLDRSGRPVDSSSRSDNPFARNNNEPEPYGYAREASASGGDRSSVNTGQIDARAPWNRTADKMPAYGQNHPGASQSNPNGIARGNLYDNEGRPRSVTSTVYPPVPNRESVVDSSGRLTDQEIANRSVEARVVARPASDQTASASGSTFMRAAGSTSRPHSLATQPLFNGLLLVSFVANIYLFFWLKNLRHQFRDLVAAKRMSKSGTPA